MKRSILLAALVGSLAACENAQSPTDVTTDITPQMASVQIQDVTVTAKGALRLQWLYSEFSEPARWMTPIRRLEFDNDPVTGDKRSVQYNRATGYTEGSGIIRATDYLNREWTVDLSQPKLNRLGNALNRVGTPVNACNAALGLCKPIKFKW